MTDIVSSKFKCCGCGHLPKFIYDGSQPGLGTETLHGDGQRKVAAKPSVVEIGQL